MWERGGKRRRGERGEGGGGGCPVGVGRIFWLGIPFGVPEKNHLQPENKPHFSKVFPIGLVVNDPQN